MIDLDDIKHKYSKYKKNVKKLIEEIKQLKTGLEKKSSAEDLVVLVQLNEALCQSLLIMTIYLKALKSYESF